MHSITPNQVVEEIKLGENRESYETESSCVLILTDFPRRDMGGRYM